MSRLVLSTTLLTRLREKLLRDDRETCAVLVGRAVFIEGRLTRLVVREPIWVPDDAYEIRTSTRVQFRGSFLAQVARRARDSGESLVFVHTHPFNLTEFSATDDAGEKLIADFLLSRTGNIAHAALLITPEGLAARLLGQDRKLTVSAIGPKTEEYGVDGSVTSSATYDRQIAAFGKSGQKRLESIRVGVIGAGGTGSVVLQQLAHLGVKDFLVIDPDVVEITNLNRLIGASRSDANTPKVNVAARMIAEINPVAKVTALQASVLKVSIVQLLADVDIVFACTDSHGSRAVLNQFAYQYLVPTIDIGVVITETHGQVGYIGGRAQMLAPGISCLVCSNLLDAEAVRRDLLTDFERKADPYILGEPTPAPAVVSLNSTVASLAVTMFLQTITGIAGDQRHLHYDAIRGTVRPILVPTHPTCVVCSPAGAIARGDEWPLPARLD